MRLKTLISNRFVSWRGSWGLCSPIHLFNRITVILHIESIIGASAVPHIWQTPIVYVHLFNRYLLNNLLHFRHFSKHWEYIGKQKKDYCSQGASIPSGCG